MMSYLAEFSKIYLSQILISKQQFLTNFEFDLKKSFKI
jgi:hypothetical protein